MRETLEEAGDKGRSLIEGYGKQVELACPRSWPCACLVGSLTKRRVGVDNSLRLPDGAGLAMWLRRRGLLGGEKRLGGGAWAPGGLRGTWCAAAAGPRLGYSVVAAGCFLFFFFSQFLQTYVIEKEHGYWRGV